MKKLVSLLLLASLPAAAIACATGTINSSVTDDVALTEADAAPDAPVSRLPPRSDAGSGDPDAGDLVDASPLTDADAAVDGADAALDSALPPTAACGPGFVQIGEYATWYGKVNVHRASGASWLIDADCASGADINTVAYCQKFWPTTTKQAPLAVVTPDNKPFTSGGGSSPACGGVALSPGQNQFACCAP